MSSDSQLRDEIAEAFGESVRADTALMDECKLPCLPSCFTLTLSIRHLHLPHIRPATNRAKIQIRSLPPLTPDNPSPTSSIRKHRRRIPQEARAGPRSVGGATEDRREGAAECWTEGWSCADYERAERSDGWSFQWGYWWIVS
jgi:hypothetical protein